MFTSDVAWQYWELHCYQLLYEIEGQPIGNRAICIPRFKGHSLREHIAANTLTPIMIIAAAQEFQRVHGLFSPLSGRRWTHGDSHTGNVLYNDITGRAYLIDFETQHEPGRAETACQADDLLVFILELMGTSSDWINLSDLFLRTYADREVLHELEHRLCLQSGLERLLWKIRTNYLPMPSLQLRIQQLHRILACISQQR